VALKVKIAEVAAEDHREPRAALIGAQLSGLLLMRYVFKVNVLTAVDSDGADPGRGADDRAVSHRRSHRNDRPARKYDAAFEVTRGRAQHGGPGA